MVLAGLLGAVSLLAAAVHLVLLHGLERPWLKRRVLLAAQRATGLEIDYESARVDLFGMATIRGLVVKSPPQVRPSVEDLIRIGAIEARWSLGDVLRGREPLLRRVVASDLALSVVRDEQGKTSFDALPSSAPPSPPGPSAPLSRRPGDLLAGALPIGALDVRNVSLSLVQTEHGSTLELIELKGLALTLTTATAGPSAPGSRVDVELGSPAAPLNLEVVRIHEGVVAGSARARLWLRVGSDSKSAAAALDVRMLEQSFAQTVSADHWLHAEAGASFDPARARAEVTLRHLEAGDGAAVAEAAIVLPDAGDPVVLRARADLDVARLIHWLPAGMVPVRAERALLHAHVESLVVGTPVKLTDGAEAGADLDLADVVVNAGAGSLTLPGGSLTARAIPAAGGLAWRASMKLSSLRFDGDAGSVSASDVAVGLDGQQAPDGAVTGRASLAFARVDQRGASPVTARDGRVEVRATGLHPGVQGPTALRGDVEISADIAAVDLQAGGERVNATGLHLGAHSSATGGAPYAGELEVQASRLRAQTAARALVDAPVQLRLKARDLRPDAEDPTAGSGSLEAALVLGDVAASLRLAKQEDAIDFDVDTTARTLTLARPFLPPDLLAATPWERTALAFRSKGRVERLRGRSPAIHHTTEVDVHPFVFRAATAQSLALRLESQGTAWQHRAVLDVRLPGMTFAGTGPSDDHIAVSGSFDRSRPALKVNLATEGHATARLDASCSFDAARRAVLYEIEAHLGGLAPLVPFASKVRGLDGFDLSRLEVGLSTRGALLGAVAAVSGDGSFRLEPNPSRTAAVEGTTDLHVANFRWAKGDDAVLTPSFAWHAEARAEKGARKIESRVEVGTLHLDLGVHDVDLNGIRDSASASFTGDLRDPEIAVSQRFAVSAIAQDLAPAYPLGDVTFALEAERGVEGVIHVAELEVGNGAAGTTLALSGNVDLGEGRRTLSLSTSLSQDLARVSTIPERFKGTGKIGVEANVTSPDLTLYTVRAAVKGEDVSVRLPQAGVELDDANGEVPITVTLVAGPNGVGLERSEKRSPYSMLRFADQHPLLARSGFLSIPRLKTRFLTVAPLVGNLEIEQNIISLRQFEMGVRGGTITGQCGLDWDGPRSTLELHVRASGVQSSHGEPFDGNIAVTMSAADRSIEGRAEILRIGERHLLDLLDLQDPAHADPAINRIRGALDLGYPESLRLVFDHGFASAHFELGGLAKLVSISDLRGIPMGPIIDKTIAPMLETPDTKEAP